MRPNEIALPIDPVKDLPVRIISFTTLYPSDEVPIHGVFVENRLRHLAASGCVAIRVIAPIPWVPSVFAKLLRSYASFARIRHSESRWGFVIKHPRYFTIPKIGMTLAPFLLFAGSLSAFRRLKAETGDFDLIDAHYFYPDGVAAILLGKVLRKRVVITARGSDVLLISKFALARRLIRYAANKAAGIIAVSQDLKDSLVALRVPASKIRVLRNGVDLHAFRPGDRTQGRARLGIKGPILLSVGHLIERKAHDLIIGALPDLPDYSLLIVGEGPDGSKLRRLALQLNVADRVHFLGQIPHEKLPEIYSAGDALVLVSSREGWPNVLLESMACGTPVIASTVGGIPEVVTRPEAGVLLSERTPAAIAAAVKELFRHPPDRASTRRYAEQFSWDATTQGQIRLFSEVLEKAHSGSMTATQS